MTDARLTPEDFARLVALPENHPDRRRAAASLEFEAHVRLLQEFESPSDAPLSAGDLAAGARELEARLVEATHPTVGARGKRRSWLAGWTGPLWGSAPRVAFSLATVLTVAVASLWLATRDESRRAVRGDAVRGTIGVTEPRETGQGVEIAWNPVAGADGYRVVFYGSEMNELARLEGLTGTTLRLHLSSLPAGLRRGSDVLFEVTALRNTDPIATSKARVVRLP